MTSDAIHIDARGEKCPMPVVLLARAVRDAAPGSAVTVLTDDPAACHDIPAWCRMRGATYVELTQANGTDTHWITLAS